MTMTKTKFWIAIAIGLGITFWLGYFRAEAPKTQDKKIVPVEVQTVTTGSIEQRIELSGWLSANQVVNVASKVTGRVESLEVADESENAISVEEGIVVKKGQRIAVIDHDYYLAQLAAAKASVEARQVELADAEREKKRMTTLFESGSATAQAKDKAITAAEFAAAALNSARANLEVAQINLRESDIVSPLDGVVTEKHIDLGNLINAGSRIVTIADLKIVKAVVSIAEKYAGQIAVGTPVELAVEAYPDKTFLSSVYSIYPSLDEQTHTIQIEVRFDNEQMLLKPGMFAKVTLITGSKQDVVVIPKDVILGGKIDNPYVYVVENSSEFKTAHKRIVEIGFTQADRCEIVEGIKPGETLVINGMQYLADGIDVEVVNLKDIK